MISNNIAARFTEEGIVFVPIRELEDEPGVDEGLDIEYYPKLVSPGQYSLRGEHRKSASVEHRNEVERGRRAPLNPPDALP